MDITIVLFKSCLNAADVEDIEGYTRESDIIVKVKRKANQAHNTRRKAHTTIFKAGDKSLHLFAAYAHKHPSQTPTTTRPRYQRQGQ